MPTEKIKSHAINRPETDGISYLAGVALLFMGLLCCLPGTSSAQDNNVEAAHWAYGSLLGTGWYKLDGNRQVYVLRVPPRWYYREATIDESGNRQWGIEFHFPLTFGLHSLDGIEDIIDFDNIGTVSFNPGMEIEFPVTQRWRLRAYGHLGWGSADDGSETAWSYDAGAKSRFGFNNGKLDWALVNKVFIAGYSTSNHTSDTLTGVMAGLDFSYPLSSVTEKGDGFELRWNINYRWFENNPSFTRIASMPVSIGDEWEIGLAIARRDGPIKLWFLSFEHMGLSYHINSDGRFQAITVNFRSSFNR